MKRARASYFGGDEVARAHAALLVMVIIWGVNFSVAKFALGELSPMAFNALRFPLAAILLYAVLSRRGRVPLPGRREWGRIFLLGLCGNLIYQLSFIYGLDLTTAGNAALLLAGTPILTALLSALVGHERVRPRVWIGVFATFAGIMMVVLGGTRNAGAAGGSVAGDLLMLAASLTWAFYTVGSKPLVDRHGSIAVTAWTLWAGTIGIVVAGVPALLDLDWRAVSPGAWAATSYAGILSIGLAYMIYYYGVARLGNTRTASYSNIVPVFALLAAWLWLEEVPRIFQLAGAAVIIGGVTVAQTGSIARPPIVSPEL